MRHDAFSDNNRPPASVASALQALCDLSATHPWFWLARTASPETLPLLALVLFDGLSGFLVGTGVCGHG